MSTDEITRGGEFRILQKHMPWFGGAEGHLHARCRAHFGDEARYHRSREIAAQDRFVADIDAVNDVRVRLDERNALPHFGGVLGRVRAQLNAEGDLEAELTRNGGNAVEAVFQ